MSKIRKVTVTTMILASSVWLAGCGLFETGEKNQIDPPKDVSLVEDQSALEEVRSEEKVEEGDQAEVESKGENRIIFN